MKILRLEEIDYAQIIPARLTGLVTLWMHFADIPDDFMIIDLLEANPWLRNFIVRADEMLDERHLACIGQLQLNELILVDCEPDLKEMIDFFCQVTSLERVQFSATTDQHGEFLRRIKEHNESPIDISHSGDEDAFEEWREQYVHDYMPIKQELTTLLLAYYKDHPDFEYRISFDVGRSFTPSCLPNAELDWMDHRLKTKLLVVTLKKLWRW